MKSACLAGALVSALLMAWAWAAPPASPEIDTVNRQAIAANEYTRFIENVFWPTDDIVAATRVPTDRLKVDIDKFEEVLKSTLRKEFVPARETIDSQVLALEGLRNGSDYLLLRYGAGAYQFQVQDGKALYLLVTPREQAPVSLDKLPEYVRFTAQTVLNVPDLDEHGDAPEVSISLIDIGNSRCGSFVYKASFVPPPKFWYSHMRWWSDGRHVLFLTTKGLRHGEDLSRTAGPPPGAAAPRLFAYKNKG